MPNARQLLRTPSEWPTVHRSRLALFACILILSIPGCAEEKPEHEPECSTPFAETAEIVMQDECVGKHVWDCRVSVTARFYGGIEILRALEKELGLPTSIIGTYKEMMPVQFGPMSLRQALGLQVVIFESCDAQNFASDLAKWGIFSGGSLDVGRIDGSFGLILAKKPGVEWWW